jgi:hypothetical protein
MGFIKWLQNKFNYWVLDYFKGNGNPLSLILIWYVCLNIVAFAVGAWVMISYTDPFVGLTPTAFKPSAMPTFFVCLIVGVLGLIITFIYPVLFTYALWQCANNVKRKSLAILSRCLILVFWLGHRFLGMFYYTGSMFMLDKVFKIMQSG